MRAVRRLPPLLPRSAGHQRLRTVQGSASSTQGHMKGVAKRRKHASCRMASAASERSERALISRTYGYRPPPRVRRAWGPRPTSTACAPIQADVHPHRPIDIDPGEAIASLGIRNTSRTRFAYPCIDWSERRNHLARTLGSDPLRHLLAQGWLANDARTSERADGSQRCLRDAARTSSTPVTGRDHAGH